MDLHISLFGKRELLVGWQELLEQEKIPFEYKGENRKNSSGINVLVDSVLPKKELAQRGSKAVWVVELDKQDTRNTPISKLPIKQKGNFLIIPRNISPKLRKNPPDRIEILRLLRKVLIKAFALAKLPYIHCWYYPQPSPTIFLFRQDIDYVEFRGLNNLLKLTHKFNIRGTYFVNISGEEEFDEEIGHFRLAEPTTPQRKEILLTLIKHGHEIANHGYWHWVFDNLKENLNNLRRANQYLSNLFNVKAVGFASPGGKWNESLALAMEQAGLLYSCSGLSNGGFPYYPFLDKRKTSVLEVPFYFFCDVSFEKNGSIKMKKVFQNYCLDLISQSRFYPEPIAIMGHPHIVGLWKRNFLSPIFKRIKEFAIPNLTIREFVCWWKRREGIKIRVSYNLSMRKLILYSNETGFFLELIFRNKRRFLEIKKKITTLTL